MTTSRFELISAAGLVLLAASAVAESPALSLPSGQSVTLYDVAVDPQSGTARFHFLAPEIGHGDGARDFEEVSGDFLHLCEEIIRPAMGRNDIFDGSVVISMADREVGWGVSDPAATQFFEMFTLVDGTCVWEGF